MHAPTDDVKTLQKYAGWLGGVFTAVAAVMSASAGYKFGGEDFIASVAFAILCGGLTFAVAIMLTFVDLAWSAGKKRIAAGIGAFFILCVIGEYFSHVAFGTGHRAANIEGATLQNTRYDDMRGEIEGTQRAIQLGEQRLAKMEAENGGWVTSQTAESLRKLAEAEGTRGGCKAKCLELQSRIAVAEERVKIEQDLTAARAHLAKLRNKSATTSKGDSIAMNQSGLFATVATGSLAPSMAAMQWANIAIGAYLSALSTGLGAVFNWLRFHPFARKEEDTPVGGFGNRTPEPRAYPLSPAGIPSEPIHIHTVERDEILRKWAERPAVASFAEDVRAMLSGNGNSMKAA